MNVISKKAMDIIYYSEPHCIFCVHYNDCLTSKVKECKFERLPEIQKLIDESPEPEQEG